MENKAKLNQYLEQVVNSIGTGKASKWTEEQLEISFGVRNDVVKEIKNSFMTKGDFDDGKIKENFLDFCNAIRALLIVYNYGDLDIDRFDEGEKQKVKGGTQGSEEEDKQIILSGMKKILAFVAENGLTITPYLKSEEINNIFTVSDDAKRADWPIIPITISATAVLVTIVYFRRAIGRKGIFSEDDLRDGNKDYYEMLVETATKILRKIYDYANDESSPKEERFIGWGFTLDRNWSRAVTLSDTYAVVDAITRFADAFDSDEVGKRDDAFLKSINECNKRLFNGMDESDSEYFVSKCISSIYKTALNVYRRTKNVYGKGVFFEDVSRSDKRVQYQYSLTSYSQIASSIRSSALFNPLYVALITLYGYNDKEIVIGRFMDDPVLVDSYYYDKTDGSVNAELLAFAKELSGYDIEEFAKRVHTLKENAQKEKSQASTNYGIGNGWSQLHSTARVFQKYLERRHPEELMKIAEYQDYLNATKDAIDQVQVMYRDFYNGQRYGVVDTDYQVFSDLDVRTNDMLNISRLNKASIGINNLRPVLLSAKILIVNALVKYPHADVTEMFHAIVESRHRPNAKRNAKKTQEAEKEWLWNEDIVDMNSTCRHCEVIMYDYFDYYDKYELGLKTLNMLKTKRATGEDRVVNGDREDQFVIQEDGTFALTPKAVEFENLVLELTKRNVDIAKDIFNKRLKAAESAHAEEIKAKEREIEDLRVKLAEREEKNKADLRAKDEKINQIKEGASYKIGETLRQWIRSEMETGLVEMMSMLILQQVNRGHGSFSTARAGEDTLYCANQQQVKDYLTKIEKEYVEDEEKAIRKYDEYAKKVTAYQFLINMAMDGVFTMDQFEHYRMESGKQDDVHIEKRNKEIADIYKSIKTALENNTKKILSEAFAKNNANNSSAADGANNAKNPDDKKSDN